MKEFIHKRLKKAGFILLKREFMPTGISLERDVSQNTSLSSIKTVFDVGANNGTMSLYFNDVFPNCKIHAFEPIGDTFQVLTKTTQGLKNVSCHKIGFSDAAGEVKIFLQADMGLNSLNDSVNVPDPKLGGKSEIVKIETIDEFCAKNNISSIDLLKTDAEGLDLKIIKGAENLIKAGKVKYILSEVGLNPDNNRNTPFDELKKYLFSHGYKLRAFYDQSNYGNKPYMTCANALFLLQEKSS